jgi:hypothetical protein
VKPAYNGTARDQTFSFADMFCSVQVLGVRILGTSNFPLKTVFRYVSFPFQTGYIIFL